MTGKRAFPWFEIFSCSALFLLVVITCSLFIAYGDLLCAKYYTMGYEELRITTSGITSCNEYKRHMMGTFKNLVIKLEELKNTSEISVYNTTYIENYKQYGPILLASLSCDRCRATMTVLSCACGLVALLALLVMMIMISYKCAKTPSYALRNKKRCIYSLQNEWRRTIVNQEHSQEKYRHELQTPIELPLTDKTQNHMPERCDTQIYQSSNGVEPIGDNKVDNNVMIRQRRGYFKPLAQKSAVRQFKKDIDGTLKPSSLLLLNEAMKSVGILFTKDRGIGTVVRVGDRFLITAWHVVKKIVLPVSLSSLERTEPLYQRLSAKSVYVDFHECPRRSTAALRFKLDPVIVFCDPELDVVVLAINVDRISHNLPPALRLFADVHQLITSANKVPCVHILGQHPIDENVVIDIGCKIINKEDQKLKSANKWINKNKEELKRARLRNNLDPNVFDTAYSEVEDEKRLVFDTFLDFGASGGAVVALLPDGVALLAIVTHGLPPFYWDSVANGLYPEELRMEVGCTIGAIYYSSSWTGSERIRDEIFTTEGTEVMVTDQDTIETTN